MSADTELYLRRVLDARDIEREQWIRFPQKAEAKFGLGRSVEHHVRLLSAHISRNHAILKKTSDGRYCIRDENSLNGVHVNDARIKAMEWQSLKAGDKVEIGRPDDDNVLSTMGAEDRFLYVVHEARPEELSNKLPGPRKHVDLSTKKLLEAKAQKKIFPKCSNIKNKQSNNIGVKHPRQEPENVLPCTEEANEQSMNEKGNIMQLKGPLLQDNEMERENKRLKLELAMKEQALKEEIDSRKVRLKEQQQKIAAELERNFKNKLVQKEEELEIRLQLEKDIAVEEVKAIMGKNEKRSIPVDAVVNTMENELQCSICSELFVISTTLNCAHTFCEYCILEWKKVKKICPVCRKPILTTTRSLVLDNYIDKAIESLSDDRKQFRAQLLEERKRLMDAQKSASTSNRGKGRRGRGNGNRGRGQWNRGRLTRSSSTYYVMESNYQPPPEPASVVIISDNESSSSADLSDVENHRFDRRYTRYGIDSDSMDDSFD